jgi:DNA-binding PadR family transcriptional regulator
MPRGGLSTADYTVLGVVWRDGPCTTYHVMLRLASSSSSFYRKRASSTYGVVQNLTKRGLLTPIGEEIGKRGDRPIGVTDEGMRVLKQWLAPPVPEVEAAYSNDLIRLRVNFIAALEPEEQAAFVKDAIRVLEALEHDHQESIQKRNSEAQAIALIGHLYETQARIAWLHRLQGLLPIAPAPDVDPATIQPHVRQSQ